MPSVDQIIERLERISSRRSAMNATIPAIPKDRLGQVIARVEGIVGRISREDSEFREEEHPRGEDGKFGSKGVSSGSGSEAQKVRKIEVKKQSFESQQAKFKESSHSLEDARKLSPEESLDFLVGSMDYGDSKNNNRWDFFFEVSKNIKKPEDWLSLLDSVESRLDRDFSISEKTPAGGWAVPNSDPDSRMSVATRIVSYCAMNAPGKAMDEFARKSKGTRLNKDSYSLADETDLFSEDYQKFERAFMRKWSRAGGTAAQYRAMSSLSSYGPNKGKSLWDRSEGGEAAEPSPNITRNLEKMAQKTKEFYRKKFKKEDLSKIPITLQRVVKGKADAYCPSSSESWTNSKGTIGKFRKYVADEKGDYTVLSTKTNYDQLLFTYESVGENWNEDTVLAKKEFALFGGGLTDVTAEHFNLKSKADSSSDLGDSIPLVSAKEKSTEKLLKSGHLATGAESLEGPSYKDENYSDLIKKAEIKIDSLCAKIDSLIGTRSDAEFVESSHPRGADGKFIKGGSASMHGLQAYKAAFGSVKGLTKTPQGMAKYLAMEGTYSAKDIALAIKELFGVEKSEAWVKKIHGWVGSGYMPTVSGPKEKNPLEGFKLTPNAPSPADFSAPIQTLGDYSSLVSKYDPKTWTQETLLSAIAKDNVDSAISYLNDQTQNLLSPENIDFAHKLLVDLKNMKNGSSPSPSASVAPSPADFSAPIVTPIPTTVQGKVDTFPSSAKSIIDKMMPHYDKLTSENKPKVDSKIEEMYAALQGGSGSEIAEKLSKVEPIDGHGLSISTINDALEKLKTEYGAKNPAAPIKAENPAPKPIGKSHATSHEQNNEAAIPYGYAKQQLTVKSSFSPPTDIPRYKAINSVGNKAKTVDGILSKEAKAICKTASIDWWKDNATKKDISAINDYSNNGYTPINAVLRKLQSGESLSEGDAFYADWINRIDNLFYHDDTEAKEDCFVYRGEHFPPEMMKKLDVWEKALEAGLPVRETKTGFTSASLGKKSAFSDMNVQYQILVRKGSRMLGIGINGVSSMGSSEDEVLLQHGKNYEIYGITRTNEGKVFIKMAMGVG